MPKCKAIQTTYLPCEKDSSAEQLLCSDHKQRLAKEAACESARTADNTSALMKAADRTTKAYALMLISICPGTEKEYADAKKDEITLKARVKTDDEKHEKEMVTKKCKDAAAAKLYEVLNLEIDITHTCYATPSNQNVQCPGAASPRDHLCTTHRTKLIEHISILSIAANVNVAPTMLPFRFGSDLNTHLLYDAFREGIRAARFARFGVAMAPAVVAPAVVAPAAPRRAVAEPILTAPVDIAAHVAKQHLEMSLALGKPITCPICYDTVALDTIVMTHCGHVYCAPCLTSVRERERKCPQCRVTI